MDEPGPTVEGLCALAKERERAYMKWRSGRDNDPTDRLFNTYHRAKRELREYAERLAAFPAGLPVLWQWRKKGDAWTLEKTFTFEVFATTDDSEVRPLYALPLSPELPNSETAHLTSRPTKDLQAALVERLRACAEEVMNFPHPSHCDHLHDASKLMSEAADILQYGDCSYWCPACYAEVSAPQHRVEFSAREARVEPSERSLSGPAKPDEKASAVGSPASAVAVSTFCNFPDCKCPMDPGPEPDWCARGFPHKKAK